MFNSEKYFSTRSENGRDTSVEKRRLTHGSMIRAKLKAWDGRCLLVKTGLSSSSILDRVGSLVPPDTGQSGWVALKTAGTLQLRGPSACQ